MKFTITNLEEVPGDLPPGTYCCHLVSATWEEWKVRFDPSHPHATGDCLLQLVKEEPEPRYGDPGPDPYGHDTCKVDPCQYCATDDEPGVTT